MAIEADNSQQMYEILVNKLGKIVPEFELKLKAELAIEINRLKKERNAVILGHNYMEPALFLSVADIVGDSLELARQAVLTDKDPIVFCGVRFMAETAKILNMSKTVLLPAKVAGCSLAASITKSDMLALKTRFPDCPIVSYVNTYADVKAETTICCTSSNAAKIASSLKASRIIMTPDVYLAQNVARELNKSIVFVDRESINKPDEYFDADIIAWKGSCEVHEKFSISDVTSAREQFKAVKILAHPECKPEVVNVADYSGSTSKMIDFVKNTNEENYLLLTECSMGENIIAENPDKNVLRMCSYRCPHMNEITLEDTLKCLQHNQYEIDIDDEIAEKAKLSLERMLEI